MEAADEYYASIGKRGENLMKRDALVALIKEQYQTPHIREKVYKQVIDYVVGKLDNETTH